MAGDNTSKSTEANGPIDLLVQLLKIATLIDRPMRDIVVAASGATTDEVKIIMCLGGEGALAGHAISDLMAIAPMNVSRALASLQQRGWVENAVESPDRRRKPVQLSAQGEHASEALVPALSNVATYLLGSLKMSEKKSLEKSIAKIMIKLEAWTGERTLSR